MNKIDYKSAYESVMIANSMLRKENKELQKENQSLRTRIKTIKRLRKHQTQKKNKYKSIVTEFQKALEKKNNKIDKAIEYIKNKQVIDLDYLEKILKDSDVNEL